MFAITMKETKNSSKYAHTILESLMNTQDGINTLKIIANYVAKTSSNRSEFRKIDEEVLKNEESVVNYLENALNYMIEVAADGEKKYTTGELAKYFGVSITAINKWVKEGRFRDVERTEKNKQLRISENTLWKTTGGELIPVKEIIEMYEKDTTISEEEEKQLIMDDIKFFEKKYGGPFENTLKVKKDKTSIEDSDSKEWEYLLKKINK